MNSNTKAVLEATGIPKEAWKVSRMWELYTLVAVILLFMGAGHLHMVLTVGDWDMYIDWKDRQYWGLVTPISVIMIPAALQGVFWTYFRLPIGMTVGITLVVLANWITMYSTWHLWTYFPLSLTMPAILIAQALIVDCVLLVTRNGPLTSAFGAFMFGFLFWPVNYAVFAPYWVAIEHMGSLASAADMIGYNIMRSALPEYLRLIERGTLRTFEGTQAWSSALFAGFACIFMHMLWWRIGLWFAQQTFFPSSPRFQRYMGFDKTDKKTLERLEERAS